jgi:hypothetical protein
MYRRSYSRFAGSGISLATSYGDGKKVVNLLRVNWR